MHATRPKATVICAGDPAGDPRPNRIVRWLRDDFEVRVISSGRVPLAGTTAVPLPRPVGRPLLRRLQGAVALKLGQYEQRIWSPGLRELAAQERAHDPQLIVVHDLALLPLALAIRGSGRVVLDAREYYSRHFEDRWFWRFFLQEFNLYLCRTYLRQADVVVTVSPGLAEAYRAEFGIACGVLPGYAAASDLAPGPVAPDRVTMIHHGFASRSRRIERMIELMRHCDARFHLDLMLVGDERRYLARLRELAAGVPRVTFRPPVPFAELVRETNRYDIGLFLVPPVSFNLRHALPNKFFEFVQARLMIAIGPSPAMASYVRRHDLGVVADDFEPRTLAARLNALDASQIAGYKENAHRAAAVLNADRLREQFMRIAREGAGVEALA